jgi:hypothetical protein
MALETSGTLSIGGTTTNRSINLELGRSATATSSLGETDLRDLADVASGTISISNFYGASSGYNIEHSLKLDHNNNEWLYRASPTAGNRQKHTFSFWIKRTTVGNPTASGNMFIMGQGQYGRMFFGSDYLQYQFDNGHVVRDVTTLHRDPAAWLHCVIAVDTTQATASNRVKQYINGVQKTVFDFDGGSYPGQNDNASGWFSTNYLTIGTAPFGGSYNAGDGDYDLSGYLAEVCGIDGTQYAASAFGEFSDDGIWIPKDVSGLSFGSEGYYLNFSNASNLGEDFSGNNNDFATSNLSAVDQATDTPTNNFATMNPLWNYYSEVSRVTVRDGGTRLTGNQSNTIWRGIPSTIPVTAGKWYWEVERGYGGNGIMVGYGSTEDIGWRELTTVPGSGSAKMMYSYNGDIYGYNSSEDNRTQYAGNYNALGDIISIALDIDNGWAYTRYNAGAWHSSGNPSSGSTGTGAISVPWSPEDPTVFVVTIPNNTQDTRVNFGGYTTTANTLSYSDGNGYGAFKYAVPTGYYALCTKNLAEYG